MTATYRTGIGAAGMVGADRITLMTMRPLGIRGVANPLAASGAADPESRDSARVNAPLTVLAMGRIVSLRDAEDFARAFAGIGKAHAAAIWHSGSRWVHVTIAASVAAPVSDGATTALPDFRVDLGSPLGRNLTTALETFKEPSMRLRLDTYQPLYFDVAAKVSSTHVTTGLMSRPDSAPRSSTRFRSTSAASHSRCRWPKWCACCTRSPALPSWTSTRCGASIRHRRSSPMAASSAQRASSGKTRRPSQTRWRSC